MTKKQFINYYRNACNDEKNADAMALPTYVDMFFTYDGFELQPKGYFTAKEALLAMALAATVVEAGDFPYRQER
jgi:hypothetical protein